MAIRFRGFHLFSEIASSQVMLFSGEKMTGRMYWRSPALVYCVALFSNCLLVAVADSAERPPNVIVILADDLGYGDLQSYGAKDLVTPHVDALMQRGMRFDNFYANCPVCSPTEIN